jgi:hypothetical protein
MCSSAKDITIQIEHIPFAITMYHLMLYVYRQVELSRMMASFKPFERYIQSSSSVITCLSCLENKPELYHARAGVEVARLSSYILHDWTIEAWATIDIVHSEPYVKRT